jgi:hypothetical protein
VRGYPADSSVRWPARPVQSSIIAQAGRRIAMRCRPHRERAHLPPYVGRDPTDAKGRVRLLVGCGPRQRRVLECSCGHSGEPGEAGHDAGALEQSAEMHKAR